MSLNRKYLFLLILPWLCSGVEAATLRFSSTEEQTAVLELFTSHGCSSCPPADNWLSGLVEHPGLWRQVIPMAFHVDYWDGLGWSDRFARPDYSKRQRAYRRSGLTASVYTPGFLLRGREWRGWFLGQSPELAAAAPVGKLSLEVRPFEGVVARFKPRAEVAERGLTAHLAVLGFSLSSRIGRGENAGRTLQEDFVVLGVSSAESTQAGLHEWELLWPHISAADAQRLAVVVWLSRPESPAPVQATGGWLH